ncbi:MAG: major facilitator superfamily 1 [Chloroflexi bacterium]|nr:major facilitator superfamily 1 [Chloroflexota bacterium]
MKTTAPPTALRRPWQETFAALQHPNYRLWFAGQLVSLVGTWMQSTAQGYLVYDLTKSPAFLGYVGFASGLPSWLFTLYGGVIADRVPRRTMLIITQTTMMLLAFLLAGLVFLDKIQAWQIVLIAFFLGIANAFDAPARQAFVVELVDREDLTNAIALNSTMFNSAIVVGPAVAGAVYAALGPAWCFAVNGLSFIAVIIALALMRLPPMAIQQKSRSTVHAIKEGIKYAYNERMTRTLILNMGVISLFGVSMMTLIPAWAVSVLGGDVRTNGLLLSARGLGALIGALMIAWLSHRGIRGKLWTAGSLVLPITMIAFSLARWLPVSMLILVFTGWSFMVQVNTSNALVQSKVPDELRGRVMSVFTLIFFGGMPLGSLWVGSMASRLGAPMTVVINAVILIAFAGFVLLRLPFIRRLK